MNKLLKKASSLKYQKNNNVIWFSLIAIILLLLAGVLIYSNTLKCPFVFDDRLHIPENRHIRLEHLNIRDIYAAGFKSYASHRPVANISFALNYYFHKYNVAGYHCVNIAIHILTAIFTYLLFTGTFQTPALKDKYKYANTMAFFAALLWLVHPIQTQAVTYIVQRMTSMAAMFYILSLLFYINGRFAYRDKKRSWPWFSGCILAAIFALGSKETAATLPVFILLYEWYFFQDLNPNWLKRKLPYVAGIFAIFFLIGLLYLGKSPIERILRDYDVRSFTMSERLLTQFRVIIYYISLLAFPHPGRLNLDHYFTVSHSLIEPVTTLLSVAVIIGLIILAVFLARRRPRSSRGLLSFCILWFLGNLVIESSVLALEPVFEHRLYLPSIFVSVAVIVLAYQLIKPEWIKITAFGIVIVLFGVWTYERNKIYADPVTLWRDCVAKSPQKARPYSNLATALRDCGKVPEAIANFRKSLELQPDSAEVYNNLANALMDNGQIEDAIGSYRKALELKPNFGQAHYNLAIALTQTGKKNEAISEYQQALEIEPENVDALSNLGFLLAEQGKNDAAEEYYKKALKLSPDDVITHGRLGLLLAGVDRIDEAIENFRIVLQHRPDDVEMYCNLGILLQKQGKLTEAIQQYKQALAVEPSNQKAQNLLDAALQQKK